MKKKSHLAASVLGAALLLVACGSSSENTSSTSNGVNDITKACQARTTWSNSSSPKCSECIGFAKAARCECQDEEYAGKCSEQQASKTREPSCEGVDACVNTCSSGDCGCVEQCYADKDTCRTLGAAVDGCLAEVCDPYCR